MCAPACRARYTRYVCTCIACTWESLLQVACVADELGVAGGRSQRKEKRAVRAPGRYPVPLTRDRRLEKAGMSWVVQRDLVPGSRGSREGRRATGKDLPGRGGNAIEIKHRARVSMPYYPHSLCSHLDRPRNRNVGGDGDRNRNRHGSQSRYKEGREMGREAMCFECWPVTVKKQVLPHHIRTTPCHAMPHQGGPDDQVWQEGWPFIAVM